MSEPKVYDSDDGWETWSAENDGCYLCDSPRSVCQYLCFEKTKVRFVLCFTHTITYKSGESASVVALDEDREADPESGVWA